MIASQYDRRAQTNTQLYAQLLADGYALEDLRRVRDAYALATRLFAAQLRPEGRPFLCHLVGVASILAMARTASTTVIGGLMHSAYSHGDFGLGGGRVTKNARDVVSGAVGPDVERVLACYSRRPWNRDTVAHWLANPAGLSADEREVAVIRLADTLEDALDYGTQLSGKADNANRKIPVDDVVTLADVLGQQQLGASLARLATAERRPELDSVREPHAASYTVGPPSWREKALPRMARWMRRVRAG